MGFLAVFLSLCVFMGFVVIYAVIATGKGTLRDFAAQPELGNENRASGERPETYRETFPPPVGVMARQARLDAPWLSYWIGLRLEKALCLHPSNRRASRAKRNGIADEPGRLIENALHLGQSLLARTRVVSAVGLARSRHERLDCLYLLWRYVT